MLKVTSSAITLFQSITPCHSDTSIILPMCCGLGVSGVVGVLLLSLLSMYSFNLSSSSCVFPPFNFVIVLVTLVLISFIFWRILVLFLRIE